MRDRIVAVVVAAALCVACGPREDASAPVPNAAPVPNPPAAAPPATPGRALPSTAFRVQWQPPPVPSEVRANSTITLPVTFTNAGNVPWPDNATADPKNDGSYAVRVVHWWTPASGPVEPRKDGQRTNLPRPIAPQETITMPLAVQTPAVPGEYRLVIELVQELVHWFADMGAVVLTLPIQVKAPSTQPR